MSARLFLCRPDRAYGRCHGEGHYTHQSAETFTLYVPSPTLLYISLCLRKAHAHNPILTPSFLPLPPPHPHTHVSSFPHSPGWPAEGAYHRAPVLRARGRTAHRHCVGCGGIDSSQQAGCFPRVLVDGGGCSSRAQTRWRSRPRRHLDCHLDDM